MTSVFIERAAVRHILRSSAYIATNSRSISRIQLRTIATARVPFTAAGSRTLARALPIIRDKATIAMGITSSTQSDAPASGEKAAASTSAAPKFELPATVVKYKTTPEWTQDTVPAGFTRAHSTAAGVWAKVVVTGGSMTFVFEAGGPGMEQEVRVPLTAGDTAITPPQVKHHVEAGPEGMSFHLEFYREPKPDASTSGDSAATAVAADGVPLPVDGEHQ